MRGVVRSVQLTRGVEQGYCSPGTLGTLGRWFPVTRSAFITREARKKSPAGDRSELRPRRDGSRAEFIAHLCLEIVVALQNLMLSFSAASLAFSGVNPLTERITPVSRSAVTMAESGTYKLHMHRAPAIVPRASR